MRQEYGLENWAEGATRPIAKLYLTPDDIALITGGRLYQGGDGLDDLVYGNVMNFSVPSVIYQRPGVKPDDFTLMACLDDSIPAGPTIDRFRDFFSLSEEQIGWRQTWYQGSDEE